MTVHIVLGPSISWTSKTRNIIKWPKATQSAASLTGYSDQEIASGGALGSHCPLAKNYGTVSVCWVLNWIESDLFQNKMWIHQRFEFSFQFVIKVHFNSAWGEILNRGKIKRKCRATVTLSIEHKALGLISSSKTGEKTGNVQTHS